jgi:hypothetical protein
LIEEFEKRRQNEETDDQTENDTPSAYPNIKFKEVENMNNFVIYSCAEGSILDYLSSKFLSDI